MTRDDIIRMAWEAGFQVLLPQDHVDGTGGVYVVEDEIAGMLERFAALVAAAEREAIGNIILDYAGRDDLSDSDESLLKHLFELIRARGEA